MPNSSVPSNRSASSSDSPCLDQRLELGSGSGVGVLGRPGPGARTSPAGRSCSEASGARPPTPRRTPRSPAPRPPRRAAVAGRAPSLRARSSRTWASSGRHAGVERPLGPLQRAGLAGDLGGGERVEDPRRRDDGVPLAPRRGCRCRATSPGRRSSVGIAARASALSRSARHRLHERPGSGPGQRDAVLAQDPPRVAPVAVVVPDQGPVAVVVEEPLAAEMVDGRELDRSVRRSPRGRAASALRGSGSRRAPLGALSPAGRSAGGASPRSSRSRSAGRRRPARRSPAPRRPPGRRRGSAASGRAARRAARRGRRTASTVTVACTGQGGDMMRT